MDTMDYHSAIKKKNVATCSNMDEPGVLRLVKSVRERQILYVITYM